MIIIILTVTTIKYPILGRIGKKQLEISSIAGGNRTWNNPYENLFDCKMFLFFDSTFRNLYEENDLKETAHLLDYCRNLVRDLSVSILALHCP